MKRSPMKYRPKPLTETGCPEDCPRPGDEAFHVCVALGIPGHRCAGRLTHMHMPKKGMGGHNPLSKIRCCGCWSFHDSCDNGVNCDRRRYGAELRGERVRFYDRDDYKKTLAWGSVDRG